MAHSRWLASTTRFANLRVALAVGFALAASVALRGGDVRACAGGDPTIEDETTFDPAVIGAGAWPGLFFDPHTAGYGDRCEDCLQKAVAADWKGFLGPKIADADWEFALYSAKSSDLAAVAQRLAGKQIAIPKDFERSSLWSKDAPVDKLRGAIALLQVINQVGTYATFDAGYTDRGTPKVAPSPPAEVLAAAKAGYAAATDPFLKQRHALQVLRVLFYRKDWAGAEGFYDTNSAALLAPSTDIAFRARAYYAGALVHDGKRARANVELARVAADYPPLAGYAMRDFQPMEDADWKKALALATTPRDKAALWQLVGIKSDPLTAVKEILKIDPKSNRVGLLIVRELARLEEISAEPFGTPTEPAALAAQKKGYAALEALVTQLSAAPTTDQPWLMDLVAAHIAARRGDVTTARMRAQRALTLRPNDARVAAQAKASLALALVLDWKIDPAHEQELAKLMQAVEASKEYGRQTSVRSEVRSRLAKAYLAAGRLVEAELLVPGTLVPLDEYTTHPTNGSYDKSKWADAQFIRDMIARTGVTSGDFDKFVLATGITRPQLERDLALRAILDGDFAGAAKAYATTKAVSTQLHTDPFVMHISDCHDCDHDKYANAPWTHATFAARLAELATAANGTGEPAAGASLSLGIALYNMTWFGNARSIADESHEQTNDTRQAERWFKRAFDLTKDPELKARAAYFAAKCEQGRHIADAAAAARPDAGGPTLSDMTPTVWYTQLQKLAKTRYYKDVLKECGYFATWAAGGKK